MPPFPAGNVSMPIKRWRKKKEKEYEVVKIRWSYRAACSSDIVEHDQKAFIGNSTFNNSTIPCLGVDGFGGVRGVGTDALMCFKIRVFAAVAFCKENEGNF